MLVIAEQLGTKGKIRKTHSKIAAVALFLCGMFVILNMPLVPQVEKSLRILDIIGLFSVIYLCCITLRNSAPPISWFGKLIFASMLLVFLVFTVLSNDFGRTIVVIRLTMSLCTAITLALIARSSGQLNFLLFGIWCGAILGLIISYGQMLGIPSLLALAPIDRVESAVFDVLRPSAIWGHPNAAAQVTMAGAALVFMIWNTKHDRILGPLIMYILVFSLNYLTMQNRAPLVVGLAICFLVAVQHRQIYLRIFAVMSLALLFSLLTAEPQLLLGDRWTGNFGGMTSEDQAWERGRSTMSGLMIALESPLGLSIEDRETRLIAETGLRASHNGFIFAALTLGPFVAFGMFYLFFSILWDRRKAERRYGFAAASVCLMLLFEDAIFEPSVTIVLALIAALAYFDKNSVADTAATLSMENRVPKLR